MAVFDGLIHTPSTDLNFTGGIERLSKNELCMMLDRLNYLQSKGETHKGRITAVTREIKKRDKKEEAKIETEKAFFYCTLEELKELETRLGATITTVKHQLHKNADRRFNSLINMSIDIIKQIRKRGTRFLKLKEAING